MNAHARVCGGFRRCATQGHAGDFGAPTHIQCGGAGDWHLCEQRGGRRITQDGRLCTHRGTQGAPVALRRANRRTQGIIRRRACAAGDWRDGGGERHAGDCTQRPDRMTVHGGAGRDDRGLTG